MMRCQLCSGARASASTAAPCATASRLGCRRPAAVCRASKGFGSEPETSVQQQQGSSSQSGKTEISSVDALEAQIRGNKRRQGRIEPQVKVQAPVVDAVTGKTPGTAATQVETAVVLGLFYFFITVMVEGLMLAGSGFMPEDWDQWVQDKVYPGYSPTVLLFLACSSLYGLYKIGKLPGQKQL